MNSLKLAGWSLAYWAGCLAFIFIAYSWIGGDGGQSGLMVVAAAVLALASAIPSVWLAGRQVIGARLKQEAEADAVALEVESAAKEERARINALAAQHAVALARTLRRAVKRTGRGPGAQTARIEVALDFLAAHELPVALSPAEAADILLRASDTRAEEERRRILARQRAPKEGMSFEAWVAQSLKVRDWVVRDAPGENGVDMIARKKGVAVGLRCIPGVEPVTAEVVEAVAAGRKRFGADLGAIITPAVYDQQAREAAVEHGVVLMHMYDLADPERRLLAQDPLAARAV